jgi:hypothetical protein
VHGAPLIAGVVVRLPATGLQGRKDNNVPPTLQNTFDGLSCLLKEGVVIAGYEQRDEQEISAYRLADKMCDSIESIFPFRTPIHVG